MQNRTGTSLTLNFRLLLCIPIMALTGCSGMQSALNPAGAQAGRISGLWWLFFFVLTSVYVLVLIFTIAVFFRRHRSSLPLAPELPHPPRERRAQTIVGSAVGVTVIILFVFLFAEFATGHSLQEQPEPGALQIKVTGRQWWWEVQYQDPTPSRMVTTANEIHVPVGRSVQFQLQSPDVIHSFWAPNFHGKKDLIPGHPTTLTFKATTPGTFRGQCAEYCGFQHAHMRFVIVAESTNDFQTWLEQQRQPGREPGDETEKKGKEVFMSASCVMCHTIQGTPARATVGPDLTHLGSRPFLGAGTIPNNLGHLGGWVLDPQSIKPGVHMPQNNLSPGDLRALIAYLESLK
jgi:cytochrome c oxidase subunit 2